MQDDAQYDRLIQPLLGILSSAPIEPVESTKRTLFEMMESTSARERACSFKMYRTIFAGG